MQSSTFQERHTCFENTHTEKGIEIALETLTPEEVLKRAIKFVHKSRNDTCIFEKKTQLKLQRHEKNLAQELKPNRN